MILRALLLAHAVVGSLAGCPFAGLRQRLQEASSVDMPEEPARSSTQPKLKNLLALDDCPELSASLTSRGVGVGPDPGQKTVKGCTCSTSCGASVDDAYTCDWCYTKDKCGRSGLKEHWDYCVYPGNQTYMSRTFEEKNSYLWRRITEDTKRGDYPSVTGILTEGIQTSFDVWGDEMPNGRVKDIHGVGAVCQFTLNIPSESPYTGLLGPGPQTGFIRMGSAVTYDEGGLTPGIGVKFSRTGVHSGDYVALHSLDFAQTWNFFAVNLSNHIPPQHNAVQTALVVKFQQGSQCPPQVGLSDLSAYSQDGVKVESPNFPFKLFLVPSAAVQTPNTEKTVDQVNAEMAAFPIGTVLYTVYACDKSGGDEVEMTPTAGGVEKACASPFKLGDMVTTTKCVSSAYGDSKFYIRHQRVEEDWQLKPEMFAEYTDAAKVCGWHGKISPTGVPKKCSAK